MPESTAIITPGYNRGYTKNEPTSVTAPGPFIEQDWKLRLEATSAIASATLVLNARLLLMDGETVTTTVTMTITGTGIQTGVEALLGRGWLIGFDLRATAGTITDTDIVASVHLVRGAGNSLEYLMCLASGPITRTRALGLYGFIGAQATSVTTTTTAATTEVANPAAGADWTTTVPAGQTWDLRGVVGMLTAAVAAANRQVVLAVDNGSKNMAFVGPTANVTALQAGVFNWFQGAVPFTPIITANFVIPFPRLLIPAGGRIFTTTTNIQAADQWSLVTISYQLH